MFVYYITEGDLNYRYEGGTIIAVFSPTNGPQSAEYVNYCTTHSAEKRLENKVNHYDIRIRAYGYKETRIEGILNYERHLHSRGKDIVAFMIREEANVEFPDDDWY